MRVNRTFSELVGFTTKDLALDPLINWIHPDDWPGLEEVLKTGSGRVEARHRSTESGWIPFEWRVQTSETGPVALGRQPGTPKAPAHVEEANTTPPVAPINQTLQAMARITEAQNPGLRCSILLVDSSGTQVTVGAGPSLPAAYNEAVEGLHIGPAVGSCGTASYWNLPVIVEDIETDPLWKNLRGAAAIAGVRACWSMPVTATDGGVLGAMALYADEPLAPTQSQMDGLQAAARMAGLAIERDRLEDRLREAAKIEAIGRLAGGVAHDFNNLLTVILGHVESMREQPDQAPEEQTLDAILHAVQDASEITSQLLAFGRKQPWRPERVDLAALMLDVMQVLDPLIGDDISVSVSSDPSLGSISIDATQLRQIMLNLVLNARDAMPHGGRLSIETRHAERQEVMVIDAECPKGSYVGITVVDSGSGMDTETKSQIFEPFFTTKEGLHGTGLGLASAYGLTRQNGGYLAVESGVGEGTKFKLFFPSGKAKTKPAEETNLATAGSVLIAEDNDAIRHLVTDILTREGFVVTPARNGAEAWSLCEKGLVVDLLIADVMMPVMGGAELARRVREILPEARVLYISGHLFDQLELPELDATRELYLAKPFKPDQLRHEVHRALSLAQGDV
ncbi:MAG: response regulator [Gemmatimonadetes bacterium]|nr:response regulator [Gemmatimonadota bacterium]MBT6149933.1 response regulator [Gemmatimonadota bacterium]MBT7863033.1 response regulator [Gemmatimonadota bacterium]